MNKRALVIGSQLPPLQGVHPDTAAMAALLSDLGFSIDKRIEGGATRAGILDGFEQLIDHSSGTDAAVIYYAGHGGYAVNAEAKPGERERYQCICPTDWDWRATGDFRGILDVELSVRLQKLTDKTPNVTVILDCCHAAEMWRTVDDELVQRAFDRPWATGVADFLTAQNLDTSKLHIESNPHAVRFVATESDRSAFEQRVSIDNKAVHRGVLTFALEGALREAGGAPLSWQTIGARVRELVLQRVRDQRPGVEGPSDRMLFTTTALKRPDAVVYFEDKGSSFLRASRILGATVGAEYGIMRPGVTDYDMTALVAHARVVELVGTNTRVEVENVDPHGPESGALAFPEKLPYPPLLIKKGGKDWDTLDGLLPNRRFQVVRDEEPAQFTIKAENGKLAIVDGDLNATMPFNDDAAGRALLVAWLERWSKAEAVLNLVGEGLRPDAIEVRWGRVEHGVQIEHGAGERVHVGDLVYVTVTNRTTQPLYFAIFDIGLGGKVTLLTSGSPGGRKLESGKSSMLGRHDGELTVRGFGPLSWASGVPEDGFRRESLVVIASTEWTEFPLLETPLLTRALTSRLETVLDSVREARYRDLPAEEASAQRGFCVHRIDFELGPTARSTFAIDRSIDAHDLARCLTVRRGLEPAQAPKHVAVRIREISLHRNGALWGKAKVRVDTLVLTGAPSNHAYHPGTSEFPRAGKNDILPMQDLLVYQGPVGGFLDFGIWVSRDEGEIKQLQDLLDKEIGQREDIKGAVTKLAALAVTAPQAAAIAAAGVAAARIVSVASKLLVATVGTSIGLYRQSFLPQERFGVGHHPVEGQIRANDFSFSFEITEVPA